MSTQILPTFNWRTLGRFSPLNFLLTKYRDKVLAGYISSLFKDVQRHAKSCLSKTFFRLKLLTWDLGYLKTHKIGRKMPVIFLFQNHCKTLIISSCMEALDIKFKKNH